VIAASGIEPDRLTIEVTESVLMENRSAASSSCSGSARPACAWRSTISVPAIPRWATWRRLPVQVMKDRPPLPIDAAERPRHLAASRPRAELHLDCGRRVERRAVRGCWTSAAAASGLPVRPAAAAGRGRRGRAPLDRHGGSFSDSFFAGLGRRRHAELET
jgi:hypothetical protein